MILFGLAAGVVIIDRIVKNAVLNLTTPVVVIPRMFEIIHIKNTGTLWGFFANNNLFFVLLSVLILAILFFSLRYIVTNMVTLCAVAAVIGGAVGNILDRLMYGSVIDMFNFYIWPVFNVADSAISIGVVVLLVHFLKEEFAKK
jgi:signal peptidase II